MRASSAQLAAAGAAAIAVVAVTYYYTSRRRQQPRVVDPAQQPSAVFATPATSNADTSSKPNKPASAAAQQQQPPPASASASAASQANDKATAEPSSDAELIGGYEAGANVRLTALKSKPELNGQRGTVVGYNEEKGRFNVYLVGSGKTMQVKPDNLMEAGEILPSEFSPVELMKLTLLPEEAFTPAHAERVVELLNSQPTQPVLAGCLLRCVCRIVWEVCCVKPSGKGEPRPHRFPDGTSKDSGGLVLCSDPAFAEPVQAAAPPPGRSKHVLKRMAGREVFNAKTLQNVEWVSLNPSLGASAQTSSFTSLQKPYFPALEHMSESLKIEALLASVSNYFATAEEEGTPQAWPPPEEVVEAAKALCGHTLFCFNAAKDATGQTIIPITTLSSTKDSRGNPTNFMLLYTCEMLLEHARPHLDALGAFSQCGGAMAVPSAPVPFSDMLASLNQPNATNAGIHLNEFVPTIAVERKALGLTTKMLESLLQMASDGGAAAGTVV